MRIAIIGAGSIGGATALGLKAAGNDGIVVTTSREETLRGFKEKGFETTLNNAQAAHGADIIIFALKPWLMEKVVRETLADGPVPGRIIVSMAPGVTAEQLKAWAPGEALAYVIPNTAAEVRQSMTFISPVTTSAEQTSILEELFKGIGSVLCVPTERLGAGIALASCGIAYALRYVRAAAEGGVQLGLFANDATKVVAQTIKGAAAILEAHGSHPEAEIDKVTTPGGMTIKGLNAMEEAGFTNAVIKGLKACLE